MTKNIYEQMVDAGVEISNHESDLYVPDNETTRAIIKQYKFRKNCSLFRNEVVGGLWWDIPFAYEPFWGKWS